MNINYQEYLKSSHWMDLRKSAIEAWGDRCSNCSVPGVDVHHLRYGTLVDVTTEDLMPLCRRCHNNVHKSNGLKDLWNSQASSIEKRYTTKAYLLGVDEAMRNKTKEADSVKSPTSFVNRIYGNDGTDFVKLEKHELKKVRARVDEYHWMLRNGIDPRNGKWKKELAGKFLPRAIFGKYKGKRSR